MGYLLLRPLNQMKFAIALSQQLSASSSQPPPSIQIPALKSEDSEAEGCWLRAKKMHICAIPASLKEEYSATWVESTKEEKTMTKKWPMKRRDGETPIEIRMANGRFTFWIQPSDIPRQVWKTAKQMQALQKRLGDLREAVSEPLNTTEPRLSCGSNLGWRKLKSSLRMGMLVDPAENVIELQILIETK